jgi:amino acid adenylation domain-containing protein
MLSSTIDELDVTSQAIIASPDDRETADYFPLSASQRRLWFLDRLEPGTGLYNVPALLRIRGNLNVEALEKSLNTIIARHETLRTSFELREDEPIQRIAPDLTLHLPIVDLSGRPQSEKEALELANLTLSQAAFDLTVAPLFQAKLFRIAPQHHLLAFVMHHIVCDGWSISVLVHEMSVLYTDFVQQGRSSLADLEIQYADWAAWEEDRLRGPLLQNQLSYWEHQLSESSPVLDLPVDFPRHSARMRAAHYASVLEEDLYHLLKNLAQENNTTLFVPLLACFQIVLSYYTGKKDISIGSPVANRNRRETETLIGCFINTLVLRTDLSGDPSLEEVLLRTKRTVLEAFDNQDIPIEKIVEALHPQRTADRTPLFQVMFTVQNTPVEKVEMPGLAIEFLQPAEVSIQHDMLISAIPQSGRLALTAEYRSELFSALTIDRMMQHYRRVVRFLATAPHLRMSEIAFLTSEEEWESAVKWNQTETSYPDDENIATLFERQARRTPDRPAVTFERQTLTYAELERRANRLARHLNSLGVGPEQIVGVFLGRDLDLVMVLLAIWKAGAAYLPLDPEYPQARIEQIVNNAAARLIITSQSLVDLLPAGGAQAICLDTDARVIEKQSDSALPVRVSGANLAYVIYTSGSTGKPKGVMIAHRSILNRVWWAVETFPLKSEDAILQKTPFSFDASIWEIFSPLLSGARLVIARPGGHRDPEYMISVIQQERITVLQLVPTMLNVLLREQGFANCTTLRRIFCGGEVLAPELVKQSRALLPAVQIQNLYGPTEASVDVSTYSCDPSTSQLQIPIGKPIANTSIYILDEHLNLVGVGVPGEICVAGDGLARGYLNSPDLTAVRFLPNPFAQHAGQRLYRTGDLGRRRNDGAI